MKTSIVALAAAIAIQSGSILADDPTPAEPAAAAPNGVPVAKPGADPDVAKNKAAQDALRASNTLESVSKCARCKGKGHYVGEVAGPSSVTPRPGRYGPSVVHPSARQANKTCEDCRGSRVAKREVIDRKAADFLKKLAEVDPSAGRWADLRDKIVDNLHECAQLGTSVWAARFNDYAIGKLLGGNPPKPGEAFVLSGSLLSKSVGSTGAATSCRVDVGDHVIVLENPRVSDAAVATDPVLVGGLFDRIEGGQVAVLRDGFVVGNK